MKLAIDAKPLVGPKAGVARYLEGVLAGLREVEASDLEVELLRPPKNGSTVWWTLRGLQRASAGGFDVLHCPFYYGPLKPRCPVTVAVHDLLPVEHPEWFERPRLGPIRWLAPRTARRAAAVVTFAEATADVIARICRVPCERIRVIPHGLDHERFAAPGRDMVDAVRRRATGGRPYLLQLGAVEPRRGVDLAVAAVGELRARWPDLELAIAGETRVGVPALDGAPAWVRRLGRVPEEDLPALYAGAEAVLAPSRGEGFDLPVLEALACGAVVVASDIPVHVEHFGEAVELFASGDADALAAALARVVEDSERGTDRRAVGITVARRFTWGKSARAHLELWREVAR